VLAVRSLGRPDGCCGACAGNLVERKRPGNLILAHFRSGGTIGRGDGAPRFRVRKRPLWARPGLSSLLDRNLREEQPGEGSANRCLPPKLDSPDAGRAGPVFHQRARPSPRSRAVSRTLIRPPTPIGFCRGGLDQPFPCPSVNRPFGPERMPRPLATLFGSCSGIVLSCKPGKLGRTDGRLVPSLKLGAWELPATSAWEQLEFDPPIRCSVCSSEAIGFDVKTRNTPRSHRDFSGQPRSRGEDRGRPFLGRAPTFPPRSPREAWPGSLYNEHGLLLASEVGVNRRLALQRFADYPGAGGGMVP